MQAILKIPFDKKDEAKKIAKENKCALWFEGMSKTWEFKGKSIPEALMPYVVDGSIIEEESLTNTVQSDNLEWPDFEELDSNSSENTGKKKKSLPVIEKLNIPVAPDGFYNYVVDMPFEMREKITQYGGIFHPLYKTYIVRARDVAPSLKPYLAQPYSYEAWIEKFINKGLVRKDIYDMMATKDVWIVRDYQKTAQDYAQKAYRHGLGGFLLADEVGLGKTVSGVAVAKEPDFKNILVVTTLAATAHWRKTFLNFFMGGHEILIINYDRLHKLFKPDEDKYVKKAKTKRVKNKRLTKTGLAPKFDLVVWDESHKMKNNTSMRSKLARKISDNALFNLYLSATAGQNPLELSYLAPLLAKITGQSVKSMDDFENWCKSMKLGVKRAEFGKWVWDGSQDSIDKIHNLLFKGSPAAALRRNPSDIAGWPEISRDLLPLELEPAEIDSYMAAWEEFKRMRQIGQSQNTSGKSKKNDNALVANLRLRQKASLLKIPYTLEYIEDLLENGHQVAVSVAFKETLGELKQKLSKKGIECSTIFGEQNAREKEEQRMAFQRGDNRVVLFTVEEAISLHQGEYNDVPRSMIIHDLRWSAISMSQIEGRTHRDGKFSQIYWTYFSNTIEQDIAQIVLNRVISMKSMVGDDTETLKQIERLLLDRIKE